MADANPSALDVPSATLRFLDRLPVSPALLGFGFALLVSALLLLVEVGTGRLGRLAAESGDGLRNVRLVFGFIAMSVYLPTATLYVLRGMTRAADELRPQLRLEESDVRTRVETLGSQPVVAFRRAGWIGVFVSLMVPLLVDLPRGEFSYALDQPVETVWHRVATPIVGWWFGRLGYVILLESRRLSDLASGLRGVDVFDLQPLLPFARQGLIHSLSLIGFVSIFAVMSFFEVGFGLAAGLITLICLPVAILSMWLPVRGVHIVIRDEKERRLAECRKKLRALHVDSNRGLSERVTRDLADVLTLRAHLEAVREWPFDVSVVVRLAVYLVIPIGSWAGAALVERAVDAFLG